MAIQLPNPGLGDGQTGDNEFVMWTKVKDNFTNTTHAASKIVGANRGQIPLSEQSFAASFTQGVEVITTGGGLPEGLNEIGVGRKISHNNTLTNAAPSSVGWSYVECKKTHHISDGRLQVAYPYAGEDGIMTRVFVNDSWGGWEPASTSKLTYDRTIASGANVCVDSKGRLHRSSSSMKYKDLLKQLELSADDYAKAMEVKPIVYRSKSEADPKDWHFLSFSAEELKEYETALTQWKTH